MHDLDGSAARCLQHGVARCTHCHADSASLLHCVFVNISLKPVGCDVSSSSWLFHARCCRMYTYVVAKRAACVCTAAPSACKHLRISSACWLALLGCAHACMTHTLRYAMLSKQWPEEQLDWHTALCACVCEIVWIVRKQPTGCRLAAALPPRLGGWRCFPSLPCQVRVMPAHKARLPACMCSTAWMVWMQPAALRCGVAPVCVQQTTSFHERSRVQHGCMARCTTNSHGGASMATRLTTTETADGGIILPSVSPMGVVPAVSHVRVKMHA